MGPRKNLISPINSACCVLSSWKALNILLNGQFLVNATQLYLLLVAN